MDPCQRCYTEDLGLESQIGPRNNPLQRCCWGPDATVGPRPGLERLVVGPTTWPSGSEMRASIPRDSTEVPNWRRRRSTCEIVWSRFLEDHEGKRLFDEEGSLWLASLDRQWRESKSGEKERDTTTLEMWNKAGPLTQIPVSRDRFPVDEPSTLDVSVRLRVDTRPRSFDQSGMIDRYRPFPRLGNNRFTRPILFVPWSPQRVPRLQHCCKCGQRGSWEMCIVFVTRERISIATRGQVWIIDRRFCW